MSSSICSIEMTNHTVVIVSDKTNHKIPEMIEVQDIPEMIEENLQL